MSRGKPNDALMLFRRSGRGRISFDGAGPHFSTIRNVSEVVLKAAFIMEEFLMSTVLPSAQAASAALESKNKLSVVRLNRFHWQDYFYFVALVLVLAIGAYFRVAYTDLDRTPVPGDEYTYHNAAKSIIEYGYMVREPYITNGDFSRSAAVTGLSPGYPVFLALVYKFAGEIFQNVIVAQVLLSIFSLILIAVILSQLKVHRLSVLLSLLLSAVYPGFLYNNDRLLTEHLFVFFMLGFVSAFISSLRTGSARLALLAALVLACAVHVRAQALPFGLLAIVFFILYGRGVLKERCWQSGVFVLGVILGMAPYWLHNYLQFGRILLLPETGIGPMIWGGVPYFLDMGATVNRHLTDVIAANSTPAPLTYWNWRVFGYTQQMWGDVWDERLVHAQTLLRPWLLLQHLLIIPTLVAIPFLARKAEPRVFFVAAAPLAITFMNAPFHGLPRYAYPALPFVFIIFGVLLSYLVERFSSQARVNALEVIKPNYAGWNRVVRTSFLFSATLLSIVVVYSTYLFAWNIHKEMSTYRLARYMGVTPSQATAEREVGSYKFDVNALPVGNATKIGEGVYVNDVDAPPVISLSVPQATILDGKRIVSKVVLKISGGFYYDFMTVYWKSPKVKDFSENHVYGRFPTNFLETKQVIYVDDDVTELLVVPTGFRGGEIHVNSIEVKKYDMSK